MKINVKVHPKSSQNKVIPLADGGFGVYTNAPTDKNRANQALVELLAGYFDVPKSSISILKGDKSRDKEVEVLE